MEVKVGFWVTRKELEKQHVQQSVHVYLASGNDNVKIIVQLRDDLIQGFSSGQLFPDEGVSECQDWP